METALNAPVGDQIHPRENVLAQAVVAGFLLLTGCRCEGELPNLRNFVLNVAPCTFNGDFPPA